MHPILLVFVAGMAIMIEWWLQLNRVLNANCKMRDVPSHAGQGCAGQAADGNQQRQVHYFANAANISG